MTLNVLEHVAAANPEAPDAELSEHDRAERDAIRVMVLAAELPAPHVVRPRRLRRRRLTLALAAVAACAAIAVGVTAAGRDASFVDRAYAAMTASGLFHVVEERSIEAAPVVFRNEPFEETPRRSRMEAWYDRGDHSSHFIVFEERDGRFVPWNETAWKDGKSLIRNADGTTSEVPRLDDESTRHDESKDPTPPTEYYAVSLFQDAYLNDKVRDDGEVTIDGRRLRRLMLDVPPVEGAPGLKIGPTEQVMLFDPDTLYPVRLTMTSSITIDRVEHPVKMTTHYRTFERLAETPENRAKLNLR
jgi:hypothetical protein